MNRLDSNPPSFAFSPASVSDLQPARRLIVLVPEAVADAALAAQKIWELADALGSRVMFIGLSKDAAREPAVRRQLVTFSALVGGGNISVESKIEFGNNWLNVVKPEWREGDVIVCFTEQHAGLARKPLNQVLESNLNAPVYALVGFHQEENHPLSRWVSSAMAWAGSIVLILVFFWLQSWLIQFQKDWVYSALLYISLMAEGGSIWIWNSLFE
ncbi:MAG: hypothetical protein HY864_07400 [Chloroflexi bacterium]|nr:hypothetical protein [Chloroflexota bacterium]